MPAWARRQEESSLSRADQKTGGEKVPEHHFDGRNADPIKYFNRDFK
jgi:hypothetical protein